MTLHIKLTGKKQDQMKRTKFVLICIVKNNYIFRAEEGGKN